MNTAPAYGVGLRRSRKESFVYNKRRSRFSRWLKTSIGKLLHFGMYSSAIFIALNLLLFAVSQFFILPFTNVGGVSVGMMSYDNARAKILAELDAKELTLSAETSKIFNRKNLGVTPTNVDALLENSKAIHGVSSWPVFRMFNNALLPYTVSTDLDQSQFEASLENFLVPEIVEPISAQLELPSSIDQAPIITIEEFGSTMSAEVAAEQVTRAVTRNVSEVQLTPAFDAPAIVAADLEDTKELLEKVLSQSLTLTVSEFEQSYTVSSEQLLTALVIDGEELSINGEVMEEILLHSLARGFLRNPSAKAPGIKIDLAGSLLAIAGAVNAGESSVELPTLEEAQAKASNGNYPKTDAGLHALVQDFVGGYPGDYRVVVRQLTGGNLQAMNDHVLITPPASTYKAFLSFAALKADELGLIDENDETELKPVRECIRIMVTYSTNKCAFAIMNHMGWDTVQEILDDAGFEDTFLNNPGLIDDKTTTAWDEYLLMRGLYDGTLLNAEHTKYILDLFKNQMYRSGIPAGSEGVVADKIGFLYGYTHDAGIIYGPKNDYILVILTNGGSWWTINELASRVSDFFNN